MKNFDKIGTTLVIIIITLSIYGAYSFRHSYITKDVTLLAFDSTSKYSEKYKQKNIFKDELNYSDPRVGDQVTVRIFTNDNPWLDGYFYQVISPREELDILRSGKQLIDNKDTVYQTMHVASVNNNDLKKIFN